MIKNFFKHTSRIRIIVLIILVITLLATLGFTFWQKQSSPVQNSVDSANTKDSEADQTPQTETKKQDSKETSKPLGYKTYKTETHPISFEYPDSWKLENMQSSSQYALGRSVDVRTAADNKISFSIGGQGLGGTCGGVSPTRSTIDVVPTALTTPKKTTLSFTLTQKAGSTYEATYGLTDSYTEIGDTTVCDNMFNYLFDSGPNGYMLMNFHGTKSFSSLDEAKTFISSEEYSAIKKMILSLKY